MKRIIPLILIMALFSFGCAAKTAKTDPKNPVVAGTTWKLAAIGDTPALAEPEATLIFHTEEKMSGTAGCNKYMSYYALTGNYLEVDQIAATKMLCPKDVQAQEDRMLDSLFKAKVLKIEDGVLVLKGKGEALKFHKK